MPSQAPMQTDLIYSQSQPAPNKTAGGHDCAPPIDRTGFALFLLLNAVLFIRPSEIIPELEGWPLYEVVILLCLLASLSAVRERLTAHSLRLQPGLVCVLLMLLVIVLSNLLHGLSYEARMGGIMFLKIVLYYLLLQGLVNSTARLRTFLLVLLAFILTLAILSLLQFHGIIDVQAMAPVHQNEGFDESTGEGLILFRLQSLGIFSDPNDFSLILVCGLLIGMHRLIEDRRFFARLAWMLPIGICGYAFSLTHSRGGFLALTSGSMAYLVSQRGWRRSRLPAAIVLPLLLLAFGGRQTNIDLGNTDDTAQGRILLWRDAMMYFQTSPIMGIGYGQLPETMGMVAHNSYVNSYAELGIFGGTCFVGVFYCAIVGLRRVTGGSAQRIDAELLKWRPCVMAMVVAYATGLISLTRSYVIPTYLVLGVAAAYGNLVARDAPAAVPRLTVRLLRRVGAVSVICLIVIYAFIKIFAH